MHGAQIRESQGDPWSSVCDSMAQVRDRNEAGILAMATFESDLL